MPNCIDSPFVFLEFLNKNCLMIQKSFCENNFAQVAGAFYHLYSQNIEFMEKFIYCKQFPQDVGQIIQKLYLFESQPQVDDKKLLQLSSIPF